ncbi:MAG: hypothetical protein LBK02_06450, partial [Treponema sp.]|nr:hypothetical protein [Treponema sp.]
MKKAIACFALLAACLFAACNVFFTNNTGEEGSLTLSLGSGGPAAGTHDAGAIFYLPGSDENGEGVAFPTLGNSRIVVYNSAGKILRDYSFTQGQASLQFSIPAGGPYWVDFSAPVVHPAN